MSFFGPDKKELLERVRDAVDCGNFESAQALVQKVPYISGAVKRGADLPGHKDLGVWYDIITTFVRANPEKGYDFALPILKHLMFDLMCKERWSSSSDHEARRLSSFLYVDLFSHFAAELPEKAVADLSDIVASRHVTSILLLKSNADLLTKHDMALFRQMIAKAIQAGHVKRDKQLVFTPDDLDRVLLNYMDHIYADGADDQHLFDITMYILSRDPLKQKMQEGELSFLESHISEIFSGRGDNIIVERLSKRCQESYKQIMNAKEDDADVFHAHVNSLRYCFNAVVSHRPKLLPSVLGNMCHNTGGEIQDRDMLADIFLEAIDLGYKTQDADVMDNVLLRILRMKGSVRHFDGWADMATEKLRLQNSFRIQDYRH